MILIMISLVGFLFGADNQDFESYESLFDTRKIGDIQNRAVKSFFLSHFSGSSYCIIKTHATCGLPKYPYKWAQIPDGEHLIVDKKKIYKAQSSSSFSIDGIYWITKNAALVIDHHYDTTSDYYHKADIGLLRLKYDKDQRVRTFSIHPLNDDSCPAGKLVSIIQYPASLEKFLFVYKKDNTYIFRPTEFEARYQQMTYKRIQATITTSQEKPEFTIAIPNNFVSIFYSEDRTTYTEDAKKNNFKNIEIRLK